MNEKHLSRPYHILNLIIAGVIFLVFIYSLVFSASKDNHPIPSFYEEITGEPSNSSGLSRAFSEIIRGNLDSARKFNQNSIPVFLFFLVQFFQRIGISFVVKKWTGRLNRIVLIDIVTSVILFLVCFMGLIKGMFEILTSS